MEVWLIFAFTLFFIFRHELVTNEDNLLKYYEHIVQLLANSTMSSKSQSITNFHTKTLCRYR